VARLLQIDESQLVTRLTTRSINVNHSVITKPLNLNEATANRDSVAKALYCGLFNWIVDRLNKESNPSSNLKCKWIGILDVFGFEIFEQNSFEQVLDLLWTFFLCKIAISLQFCINYANERLQAYFNFHVLKSEQDLYRREALLWTPVDLPDNSDCIELIEGKMTGIFPVLDSANVQPQGTDKIFTQNLFKARLNHRRMERVTRDPKRRQRGQRLEQYNGFRIQHYAGAVIYDAKEFLVKNADTAHPNTSVLMSQSKCSLVSQLLQSTKPQGRRGSMAFVSVSNTFRRQLGSLMSTLEQTNPYFVRCVKPNSHKKPGSFLPEYVLPQLRYACLLE
jgi:myosin-5